ncbi:MAG: hypothetical protein OXI87_01430 [Albidovulum sp.]|nr:hypothetical protein [Albidovulum sp.]MDE0531766.1 hypothetical protein [Albidovulum sp.]
MSPYFEFTLLPATSGEDGESRFWRGSSAQATKRDYENPVNSWRIRTVASINHFLSRMLPEDIRAAVCDAG